MEELRLRKPSVLTKGSYGIDAPRLLPVLVIGVADRVAVRTADLTALPFESASFDVIVSSVAIHNVDRLNRDEAIEEAV